MKANQADYPVSTLCRVLGVSPSGYYAWRDRGLSAHARRDAELKERICVIHADSRGTYGVPRIFEELKASGILVGRKRIARLMRELGIDVAHQCLVAGLVVLLDEADAVYHRLRLRLAKRLAKRRVIGDVIDLN